MTTLLTIIIALLVIILALVVLLGAMYAAVILYHEARWRRIKSDRYEQYEKRRDNDCHKT